MRDAIDMEDTQLNNFQKTQNRAMRVILECDIRTKVECMLRALQFMVYATSITVIHKTEIILCMYVHLFLRF